MCGYEFITLSVSNRNNHSNHFFGTIIGEEYFKSSQLDSFLNIFNNFSVTYYQCKYYKPSKIYS